MPDVRNETAFAPPGRSSRRQIAEQISHCLDDPCIKVVLQSVSGFLAILNAHRQILAANRELLDALGRQDPECIVGLRMGEAFNCVHFTDGSDGCGTSKHCRTCGAVLALLLARNTGAPVEDECRLSTYRDGKLHAMDLKVRATPLRIGDLDLTACVLHDISALKRREVLEQVFLHDFLDMLCEIAGHTRAGERADERTIAREIASLVDSLKEEVLTQQTLLAAERGELLIKPQPFAAVELFAKLDRIFARHPVAQSKRLTTLEPPSRSHLVADQALLTRVLVCMLKNAFEATEPGGEARLWLEWDGDMPTFIVQNASVIPEEIQSRIFERSFSTRAPEGRGIGTYSMKLYGERYMGGKVFFTSDLGGGTRFAISLPPQENAQGAQPARVPLALPRAEARRILLVDDNEPVLRLGSLFLSRLGYSVRPCRSSVEAVEVFVAAPRSFDAVIMAWTTPVIGGSALVERLLGVRADLPVVVWTGMNEAAVRDPRVRASIAKPPTFDELDWALKCALLGEASGKALTAASATVVAARPTAPASASKSGALPTVYLVDDDVSAARSLERQLRSSGFPVEAYSSGVEFLARWRSGAGCLVAKLEMPGTSGLAMQDVLLSAGARFPAIFITEGHDVRGSVMAMKKGAIDVLTKPFEIQDLVGAIERALARCLDDLAQQSESDEARRRINRLTPREAEVATRLGEGMSNKQIAAALGITEKTIQHHRASLMKRLKVRSLPDLVRLLNRVGIR